MRNNKLIIILATASVVMLGYWFISKKGDLSFLHNKKTPSKKEENKYKVGGIVIEHNEANEAPIFEKIKTKFQNVKDKINNWLNSNSITDNVKKVVSE